MSFSLEEISPFQLWVVDGGFVIYVVIPPSAPREKSAIRMALQFARV